MGKSRKRNKNWSTFIHEAGYKIRLYERTNGASVYYSFVLDGKKIQKSTKRTDREEAENYAREVVKEIVRKRLLGHRDHPVTLGDVFDLYFEHKAPLLSETRRGYAQTRKSLFLEAWPKSLEVDNLSQAHVDRYVAGRRSGGVSPFEEGDEGRDPTGVRDGTIDSDFRWLSSVFNWARKHKVGGRRLLPHNPLHDLDWPTETNVRRPVASHKRFSETMKHVDKVDETGRLRCMLALARWTGHRESAICELRASDVLRTEEAIGRALAEMGMDESRAEHMPHGAIRWREESDKMGFDTIAPLNPKARREVDRYLRKNPRVGEAWLFPAPRAKGKHIHRDLARKWLLRAEKAAGLPKLRRGAWHPYRRLWASERKHLPDADVAAAGGWRDTRALKQSYQQADPATILEVVEAGG